MNILALIIFFVTYAGVALGRIPGLALDRTGIALLGAIAMVAFRVLPMGDALRSVDMPTILLLYALMIVSAQLRLGGFYTFIAMKISGFADRPHFFLFIIMFVSAVLSSVLANDIICLAFTPVLAVALLRARLNPVPYLIGLAVSSNIGSAATIIGNPQNMLIGQVGNLNFGKFFIWCGPPSLLSLAGAYGLLALIYRRSFATVSDPGGAIERLLEWPEFNRWQSLKGIAAVSVLIALFFSPFPRELTALTVAGLLLCSRKMNTRSILGLVDWHLITLFCGLFIVIKGFEIIHLPEIILNKLEEQNLNIRNLYALAGISAVLSNFVSNVPAVMILSRFLVSSETSQWYVLALASTYAGNLITIGSIANLITFEQAAAFNIRISFREHAKAGIPITLFSLLITVLWIFLMK